MAGSSMEATQYESLEPFGPFYKRIWQICSFGSIKDATFKRPRELDFKIDRFNARFE